MSTWVRNGLLCLCIASLAGCAAAPQAPAPPVDRPVANAPPEVTSGRNDPQRDALGDRMLAVLLGAAPVEDRPQVARYVALVGHWLLQQVPVAERNWRFLVLEDAAIFQAGLPSGCVVISSGLLESLQSEAELAAALAMAIEQVQADAYLRGTGAASLPGTESGLSAAALELLLRGPAASAVQQADQSALHRLQAAGYDPWALPALLQRWAALPVGAFSDATLSGLDFRQRLALLRAPLNAEYADSGGAEIGQRFRGSILQGTD